ncbi:NUDIX domain-containing protein [Siphonobacter curvatus]|uniref:NUDIX hydrolase n=1 Tax=Siphonobacter curvatus TaxID=2094562 RepID=A0A2S7ISK3_9BACT|nr:NUDIX hydrolase [Siphonobacter curvatus]PQA60669.1 NUDIX hydrolase [Siphonobacter curvatus]
MSTEVLEKFGGYVRVRVCGIAVEDDRILLIRHKALFEDGPFWAPPGGSLEFGESIPQALVREFNEETQLQVRVGELLYVNEFIRSPLHTLEVFFRVFIESGQLQLGHDPEFQQQIMEEAAWLSWEELQALPDVQVHSVFRKYTQLSDLLQPGGYGLQ